MGGDKSLEVLSFQSMASKWRGFTDVWLSVYCYNKCVISKVYLS